MAVTVRIPPNLRKLVGGQAEIETTGATVIEAVANVSETHGDLKARLLDEDGGLAPGLNIFVNFDSIKKLDGIETKLSDGDRVVILLAMAGG